MLNAGVSLTGLLFLDPLSPLTPMNLFLDPSVRWQSGFPFESLCKRYVPHPPSSSPLWPAPLVPCKISLRDLPERDLELHSLSFATLCFPATESFLALWS